LEEKNFSKRTISSRSEHSQEIRNGRGEFANRASGENHRRSARGKLLAIGEWLMAAKKMECAIRKDLKNLIGGGGEKVIEEKGGTYLARLLEKESAPTRKYDDKKKTCPKKKGSFSEDGRGKKGTYSTMEDQAR